MATVYITLTIRVSWWVFPALQCIAWYSRLIRTTPDIDKVATILMHGVKLRVV